MSFGFIKETAQGIVRPSVGTWPAAFLEDDIILIERKRERYVYYIVSTSSPLCRGLLGHTGTSPFAEEISQLSTPSALRDMVPGFPVHCLIFGVATSK